MIQSEAAMKYALPVLVALALAIPATAMAAKPDMSCVKGDCKKTDPAAAAAQEMYKAAGQEPPVDIPVDAPVATPEEKDPSLSQLAPWKPHFGKDLGNMPPDSAISEIAKAVDRDLANRMSAPVTPTGQQESCGGFKAGQEAQRTNPYTAELQRSWLENRQKIEAYGAQLKEEQLAMRQKMVAYDEELKAQQANTVAEHVRYSEELKQAQLAMRQKMVAYDEELKVRQQLMRCPTPEMYTRRSSQ
jgi:hypothetical protein